MLRFGWVFHRQPEEALPLVENARDPNLQRIAGLILLKEMHDPARALVHPAAGPLDEPIAVTELDELYAALGLADQHAGLLAHAPRHRLVIERQADLALARGNPAEALSLLASTTWPCEHQRYVRTGLWRQAKAALDKPDAPVPASLNEDIRPVSARTGRSFEPSLKEVECCYEGIPLQCRHDAIAGPGISRSIRGDNSPNMGLLR